MSKGKDTLFIGGPIDGDWRSTAPGPMDILYLPLEFSKWYSAKRWPYPLGIGLSEGFDRQKIHHVTVPITYHESELWCNRTRTIVGTKKFDQVWLEVVHTQYPEGFMEWLVELAPIRVGFVVESLTIGDDEWKTNYKGTLRRVHNFESKLPHLTHLIVTDERDLAVFQNKPHYAPHTIPVMLGIASIPEFFVRGPSAKLGKAVFFGTLYGERMEWAMALQDRMLVNPPCTAEDSMGLLLEDVFRESANTIGYYRDFFGNWQDIRCGAYSLWIAHLRGLSACAFINLPHRTNVLSGRVVEGIAAGKPIISPRMHNGADELFKDGEEILLYNGFDDLVQKIDMVMYDEGIQSFIASNARAKLLQSHTTEVRVKEVLDFVGCM